MAAKRYTMLYSLLVTYGTHVYKRLHIRNLFVQDVLTSGRNDSNTCSYFLLGELYAISNFERAPFELWRELRSIEAP